MRKLTIVTLMGAILSGVPGVARARAEARPEAPARTESFAVASKSFRNGARLPSTRFVYNKLGCGGGNVSPEISWQGAPKNTKSYAVTLFDPDAKTGSGWWHWVVFDIPPAVRSLPEGASGGDNPAMPEGVVESRTDFGTTGYQGPCPPAGSGLHHYVLTVYALDTATLDLDPSAPAAKVGGAIHEHALAHAVIRFVFSREKAE